ncbi:hypothetical protein EDD85DRAFT_794471 [Armillaria nabsnona]|nr:hypothetical protein EDD85DRAFT_794471 [Armillaria nabsnona]
MEIQLSRLRIDQGSSRRSSTNFRGTASKFWHWTRGIRRKADKVVPEKNNQPAGFYNATLLSQVVTSTSGGRPIRRIFGRENIEDARLQQDEVERKSTDVPNISGQQSIGGNPFGKKSHSFPLTTNTIEVALEEEERAFLPIFDAYYNFLVTIPTKFSWSLVPLNGLKTPYPALCMIHNAKENEEVLYHYSSVNWICVRLTGGTCQWMKDKRFKAVLQLWPLGQEPRVLPLYGAKRRDRDDGIGGVGRRSWLFERTVASTFKYVIEIARIVHRGGTKNDRLDYKRVLAQLQSRLFYFGSFCVLSYPPGQLVYEKDAAVEQARRILARTVVRRLLAYFVVPSIRVIRDAMLAIGAASEFRTNIITQDCSPRNNPSDTFALATIMPRSVAHSPARLASNNAGPRFKCSLMGHVYSIKDKLLREWREKKCIYAAGIHPGNMCSSVQVPW